MHHTNVPSERMLCKMSSTVETIRYMQINLFTFSTAFLLHVLLVVNMRGLGVYLHSIICVPENNQFWEEVS